MAIVAGGVLLWVFWRKICVRKNADRHSVLTSVATGVPKATTTPLVTGVAKTTPLLDATQQPTPTPGNM